MADYLMLISGGVLIYSIIMLTFGRSVLEREAVKKRLDVLENVEADLGERDFENIPFSERVLKPVIDKILANISSNLPIKEEEVEAMQMRLLGAGIKMKYKDYLAATILFLSFCAVLGIIYGLVNEGASTIKVVLDMLVALVVGYILVNYNLVYKTRVRAEAMDRQFPEFLDLLSVCIEAGLGFDQAVKYVSSKYEGELSDEFKLYLKEITLGSTRKDALESMEQRCNLESLKAFSAAVIQADEMGISLKQILDAQAYNVRERRKQKVEEEAQKLPIKILFPIVIFIFPIIFIVLMLPAGVNVMHQLSAM